MDKKPTHLTFFDLDETLLTVNSGFKFGLFLFRERVLPLSRLFYLFGYYFRFKLGLITPKEVNERACSLFLNGLELNFLESYVAKFLDSNLDKWINPQVIDHLVDAQKKGHYTTILSSSPEFLVKQIKTRLGIDEWGATEYYVNVSGIVSGIKTHMGGEEKANYLIALCKSFNLEVGDTTAYSDSIVDLPFLQAAGFAVAVNPDKKLRQLALANNWKII